MRANLPEGCCRGYYPGNRSRPLATTIQSVLSCEAQQGKSLSELQTPTDSSPSAIAIILAAIWMNHHRGWCRHVITGYLKRMRIRSVNLPIIRFENSTISCTIHHKIAVLHDLYVYGEGGLILREDQSWKNCRRPSGASDILRLSHQTGINMVFLDACGSRLVPRPSRGVYAAPGP